MRYSTAPAINPPRILGSSNTASSVTGTLSETQLAAITVPANLMGTNGTLRITTQWTATNNANNKTVRVRFSGSGGTAYSAVNMTTQQGIYVIQQICNNNATNAQKGIVNGEFNGFNSQATSAADTAAATTVYISAQLANVADTATLEAYTVEFIPAV